jgi:hypothetical protein
MTIPEPNPNHTQATHPPRPPGGGLDRVWLRTWTTYGTRLPGDDRGFVSNGVDAAGRGRRLNLPRTEPASQPRRLTLMAQDRFRGPPIWLTPEQAPILLDPFRETANHRGWSLVAVAIRDLMDRRRLPPQAGGRVVRVRRQSPRGESGVSSTRLGGFRMVERGASGHGPSGFLRRGCPSPGRNSGLTPPARRTRTP